MGSNSLAGRVWLLSVNSHTRVMWLETDPQLLELL